MKNKPTPETDAFVKAHAGKRTSTTLYNFQDLAERLENERDEWKSNHDNQVYINQLLRDRPDLKERAKLVDELIEKLDEARKEAEMWRYHWEKRSVMSMIVSTKMPWEK